MSDVSILLQKLEERKWFRIHRRFDHRFDPGFRRGGERMRFAADFATMGKISNVGGIAHEIGR
jgi:hypothetical protein